MGLQAKDPSETGEHCCSGGSPGAQRKASLTLSQGIKKSSRGLGGHYAKWSVSDREDKYCLISLTGGIWKIQQTSEYNQKEADSQVQRPN